jgi:DNA-directed RNA polymerase specialized sigma24 family protein
VLPVEFAQLVAAIRTGDERAFGLLWRRTNPGLLRSLNVVATGRAAAVAAATWRELVRELGRFGGSETQWRTLVYVTARRRAAAAPLAPVADPAAEGEPASEQRLGDVVTAVALEVVAALRPAEREVLVLRTAAGLSVAQVAEVTGLSPQAVRAAARHALAQASILAADPGVRRRIDRGAPVRGAAEPAGASLPGPMPSESVLEDLLTGRPAHPAAGSRTRLMASLVAALSAPPTPAELRESRAACAAFRREIARPRRSRTSTRLGSRLAVGVAAASIVMSGAVAAAYSGVLPGTLQDIAHHLIHAPSGKGGQSPAPEDRHTPGRSAPGPASVSATTGAADRSRPAGATGAGTAQQPGPAGPTGTTPPAATPSPGTTPPGGTRTPPGETRTPPGETRTPPGETRTPPGDTRTPPGATKTPPGRTRTPPKGTPGSTKLPSKPSKSSTPPKGSATPSTSGKRSNGAAAQSR